LFNDCGGYFNRNNEDLQSIMIKWNLKEEDNLKNSKIALLYIPWCFSVSFLQMINAWQWFFPEHFLHDNLICVGDI